jgi:hypothetical protein
VHQEERKAAKEAHEPSRPGVLLDRGALDWRGGGLVRSRSCLNS